LSSFFLTARRYESILEVQFNLAYHNILSASEYDETDLKDIDWLYSRLAKQKQEEAKTAKQAMTGKTELPPD